jgi:NhaP-type Na+/H+ or K+/H+ antiporter
MLIARLTGVSGWLFSRLMQYTQRRGFIDRESYIAQYIALTLFTTGIARTLGSDDLLASFAAGKNSISTNKSDQR